MTEPFTLSRGGLEWVADREQWDADTAAWREEHERLQPILARLADTSVPTDAGAWQQRVADLVAARTHIDALADEAMILLVTRLGGSVRGVAAAAGVNPATVSRKTKGRTRIGPNA